MVANNVIELQCVVVANEGWFLADPNTPRWTNKVSAATAKRFSLTKAREFVKEFQRRNGTSGMRIQVLPTM